MTHSGFAPERWEAEGQRLAPLLDSACSVVIAARDPSVAALTAVGLARAQGRKRRVAVADLLGESPALEVLLSHDDPHGVSDSFLYGVSLNKIARPMIGADNVYIMPGGTEPSDDEAIYSNERWRRLTAGFHEVGALLLIVANPNNPGFGSLCANIGALMPVGDTPLQIPHGIPVIAVPSAPPVAPEEPETETRPPRKPESTKRAREAAQLDEPGRRRHLLAILLVVLALAVAAGAFWPQILDRLPQPLLELVGRAGAPDSLNTAVPPTRMDAVPRGAISDSSVSINGQGTMQDSGVAPASPPLVIDNPADSASASRYAIYFATANTRAAAIPEGRLKDQGGIAVSPVLENGEQWFRVTVGAAGSRAEAEALLAQLQAKKLIGSGSIVSVPFALRLERQVAQSLVAARLSALKARGIEAYALRQNDGSAFIYTGAFETPEQATSLADSLRSMGVAPVLAYRTGREF